MSTHLDRLARRVMRDAFFLAAPLARYAESQQMSDDALANYLGCGLDSLTHLRLCRNPDPGPPHFWRDIEKIASRFHVDPDTLAEIVRLGQALFHSHHSSGEGVAKSAGYLMAARDGEPACETESAGGGDV
jgi:hypothetical protein